MTIIKEIISYALPLETSPAVTVISWEDMNILAKPFLTDSSDAVLWALCPYAAVSYVKFWCMLDNLPLLNYWTVPCLPYAYYFFTLFPASLKHTLENRGLLLMNSPCTPRSTNPDSVEISLALCGLKIYLASKVFFRYKACTAVAWQLRLQEHMSEMLWESTLTVQKKGILIYYFFL